MLEHIVCPNCGNEFSLDISETRTRVVCGRCREEFVHTSDVVPIDENVDPSAETMEISAEGAEPGKNAAEEPEAPSKAEEEMARPGMTVGNYEIIEEVGRGAVGVVYKARQKNLNRMVALKILLAGQAASEEQIKRFHHEALAVAKLRHPNIVPVYDVGVHEGKHYFAMEYVDGRPLHRMMKKNRFSPNQALDVILKVASAISDAHKHGIIHRDIKPANIMIDESGRVQVMDFGLAKEVEADAQFTRSGTTMGTPNYMPVEQARGDNRNIDERSDIYSLGAVLYEMLTGVPPFVAETNLKTILKVINEEPLPPRRRNPHIHKDIETICVKAMEKEKSRRYQTVDEFIEDIKRFQAGEPILARPPSTIYRISKKFRKHRAVIAGSLSTIAVIVILVLLWNLIFPPQPPQPPGYVVENDRNGNKNNGANGERLPQLKKVVRYEDALLKGEEKKAFLEAALTSEQYGTDPTLISNLPGGKLPEQVEVETELQVAPDALGTLGICLYARTDRPTLENYAAGFVVTLDFREGALRQATFQNRQKKIPMVISPALKPEDGKFHVVVSRRGEYVLLTVNEQREPFRWTATGRTGLGEDHGEGVGIALSGRGIDFGPMSVREIFLPWSELYLSARKLFDSGSYPEARKEYERLLAAYSDERGDPDSKIPEEEFVRAELHTAICLAHEAGVYAEECDDARAARVAGKLREFIGKYAGSFPDDVLTAEECLLHVRFRVEGIDLATEAVKLADRYDGVESSEVLRTAFIKLPSKVIKKMLERDIKNIRPEDIEGFILLAEYDIAEGYLDDAAGVLEMLSDYYAYHGEFEMALQELDRILSLQFPDAEHNMYRKIARIKKARVYLLAGDYEQYTYTNGELYHISEERITKDDGTYDFVFDPLLGPHKVAWGRTALERWLSSPPSERKGDDLWTAHLKLSECLKYIEPEKPPKPEGSEGGKALEEWSRKMQAWQIEHLQWEMVILSASAELVRVEYARGTSPTVISKLLEPFQKNPNLADELRAELGTLLAEVLEHSKQYYRAREMCREIIDNYSNLVDSGIRAVNIIVQTRILEARDPVDISIEEIKRDLMLLDRFPNNSERKNVEARVDAMMKAAYVGAVQYAEAGRDEAGRETARGREIRRDLQKIWQEMEEVMNDAGLSSESFVRRMHELMEPGVRPTEAKILAYSRGAAMERDSYKRNEMKFTLALRLLLEDDPRSKRRAGALFEEIIEDDKLDEHWFTRFLKKYQKRWKEPVSSSST
ncbi:MAG: hypothetical protein DRP79_04055 [Planctomycetota bacterium]|nr:MAG: hypothetical protein DRP79_04055 [Planctomycetota bacterium]